MNIVKSFKNNSCYIYSFFISIVFILLAFAIAGVYPFGDLSMAVSDLRVQYLDLTIAVAEKIKNGENIFLTMATGGGINLYAWCAYILFNPLNVLFLIIDLKYIQEIYLFIYVLKIGFAGLCASVYFKRSKILHIDGLLNTAFAVLYALCMFNIKASINIMWLDNVALLPICFLGIERLIEKRKVDLFTLVYFACVMTNYYLAFVTGVFSFVYFVYYVLLTKSIKENKAVIFKAFLLLIISAALALGLSGIMLVPTYSAVSTGYSEMFNKADSWVHWELSDIFQGLLFIINATSVKGILLISFSGIVPLFLIAMLLLSNGAERREKLLSLLMVLFFIMGFWFEPLYLALHFFRDPAGFYGRFSYAMTLLFIILALRCVVNIKAVNKWACLLPTIIFVLGVNLALSAESTFWYLKNGVIVVVAVIVYTAITAVVVNKGKVVLFKRAVSVIALIEACIMAVMGIYVMKTNDGYQPMTDYSTYLSKGKALISEIDEKDDVTEFYRASDIHSPSVLSSMSVGYNDICAFSSLTNQNATGFMSQLGMCSTSGDKYVDCSNNTLPVDSLFDIKYVMASDQSLKRTDNNGKDVYITYGYRLNSPKYEKIIDGDNGAVFKNLTAFPLMFGASDKVINATDSFVSKTATYNGAFNNQEVFFNSLFDNSYEWYPRYKFDAPKVTNGKIVNEDSGAITLKLTNLSEGFDVANENDELCSIKYTFKVEDAGQYYTNFIVEHNKLDYNETQFVPIFNNLGSKIHFINNSAIIDLGYFEKGEEIWFEVQTRRELTMYHPSLVRLNMDAFEKTAETAQNNGLKNIYMENSDIFAQADFEQDSFVFTTIAYDEGFDVYVDDVKTQTVKVCNGLLGYYVPAGQHNIAVKYVSPGFEQGKYISLISLVVTIIVFIINYKYKPAVKNVVADTEIEHIGSECSE